MTAANTLPTSVRGQPLELRRLIRKKQNSESAKRCRLRRKKEAERDAGHNISTAQKRANLEALVAHLAANLVHTQNAVAALLASNTSPPQSLTFASHSQNHFFNAFQQHPQQQQQVAPTEPLQLPQTSSTATTSRAVSGAAVGTTGAIPAPTIPLAAPEQTTATLSTQPQTTAVAAVSAYDTLIDEATSSLTPAPTSQEVGSPMPFSDLHNFQLQVPVPSSSSSAAFAHHHIHQL